MAKAFVPNLNNLPRVQPKNGIKTDNRAENLEWHNYSMYHKNEDYFETINTERKAYFLGFLFADGNNSVKRETARYIQWNLIPADSYMLEEFSLDIYGDKNHVKISSLPKLVKFPRGKTYKNKGANCITICSQKLSKDLEKHGCIPRKSLVLKFPTTVPGYLMNHFVRGYFDGDGCISKLAKKKKENSIFVCAFVSSSEFIIHLSNFLRKYIDVKGHITQKKKIFQLTIGGNQQAERLCDWLYKDASIFLKRKQS